MYSVTSQRKFVQEEFGVAPGTDSTVTQMPPSSVEVELTGDGLVFTLKHPADAIATVTRTAKSLFMFMKSVPYGVFEKRVVRRKADFAAARPTLLTAGGRANVRLRPAPYDTRLENALKPADR